MLSHGQLDFVGITQGQTSFFLSGQNRNALYLLAQLAASPRLEGVH